MNQRTFRASVRGLHGASAFHFAAVETALFTLIFMTFAALLSRLRMAIVAAWVAPYALFCLFIQLAATPERYVVAHRLGPATFATVVGVALAAALGLSRFVQRRCADANAADVLAGLKTFAYAALTTVTVHVGIVTAVAFYETGMHLHLRAAEVAILATLSLLYTVLLGVPLYLACAELFGRYFGPRFETAPLLPTWLTNLLVGGAITLAGCTSLALAAVLSFDALSIEIVLVAIYLLLFGLTVSFLAHRGLVVAGPAHPVQDEATIRRVEERIARSEMFAEASSDFFFELDAELCVSFVSERFAEVAGLRPSEILGRSMIDLLRESTDPVAETHRQRLLSHHPFRGYRFVYKAYGRVWHLQTSAVPFFDAKGEFAGYRGCGTDVTPIIEAQLQLRTKEAELAQAQKMEAVGHLTGGVAHDFNNLLSVIVGNIELLKLRVHRDADCVRYADQALAATERGASLIRRLLAFSRHQTLSPRVVDVAVLLNGMEDLMRRTLGDHVRVEVQAAANLNRCIVDPHQLENAVLNIAINARDAMPAGGRISIVADNFTQPRHGESMQLAPGQYVRITIEDDGEGIEEELLPHVFEPFFTTKEPGRGSGLGLSMVYGFLTQSGGHVAITSARGRGTTVTMLLPAGEQLPGANRPTAPEIGAPSVLVIEDEPPRTSLICRALRDEGYRVLIASDADEALRIVDKEPVDVVIADSLLPHGVSGFEMADRIAERAPHVRILLMSLHDERANPGSTELGVPVLRKPVDFTELSWRVAAAVSHVQRVGHDRLGCSNTH